MRLLGTFVDQAYLLIICEELVWPVEILRHPRDMGHAETLIRNPIFSDDKKSVHNVVEVQICTRSFVAVFFK